MSVVGFVQQSMNRKVDNTKTAIVLNLECGDLVGVILDERPKGLDSSQRMSKSGERERGYRPIRWTSDVYDPARW